MKLSAMPFWNSRAKERIVTMEQGLATVRVASAMIESAQTRQVISILKGR
jgi:glycerol kinase